MMFAAEDTRTIVVFRALQLGDLLCSIPAFRALRAAYPSAHIAIVGLPWMKMLPQRYPAYFDEFIDFAGYPGLPEQPVDPQRTVGFLTSMQHRRFDLALQMQGNGSVVNPMAALFGARNSAGFFRREDYFPGPGYLEYPAGIHEIHRHLRLMQHLEIPAIDDMLEFPIFSKDEEDLAAARLDLGADPFICVHPGSRGSWRRWPPAHFALLARQCISMGYRIVVTGTTEELPIVDAFLSCLDAPAVVAAGKTSMGAMAAMLRKSAGLISNCTGVSHIAAALKVKSIVISMDGEPERWAPLNTNLHKTFDWTTSQDLELVTDAVRGLFATVA